MIIFATVFHRTCQCMASINIYFVTVFVDDKNWREYHFSLFCNILIYTCVTACWPVGGPFTAGGHQGIGVGP